MQYNKRLANKYLHNTKSSVRILYKLYVVVSRINLYVSKNTVQVYTTTSIRVRIFITIQIWYI